MSEKIHHDGGEKRLLLGDEAIALGALHAGLSGVYAYPGTPSTEITEYIQTHPEESSSPVRSRWCTNEKTAMEAALGMSFAGKRALVCMKHVGMNVCADAFVNAAVTGIKGGVVVLAADDPSMHSSQNEQDSRFYGKFALMPILEPSNQQEAYDMVREAFDLSERLSLPVLMRIVTRLAHSRSAVLPAPAREQNALDPDRAPARWVLLPGNARRQYAALVEKQADITALSETSGHNRLMLSPEKGGLGVIAAGTGYNYVMEAVIEASTAARATGGQRTAGEHSGHWANTLSLLKISQYPLPGKAIKSLAEHCSDILVVEDGQPFIEELLPALIPGKRIGGRLDGRLPRTGELTPDNVAAALGAENRPVHEAAKNLSARPPQLCKGCGHRDVYAALSRILEEYPQARVFGDIGCYTLGALPPYKALDSCVDMGASITMAKGAADAGLRPAVAVIGDSTFTHSGMTGLLDAVNDRSPITVILSDNLTTAMTGGQDSAGTYKYEQICLALGVEREHLHVVNPVPANMEAIAALLREELAYEGVSVIIPRRECMQTLARKKRQQKQSAQ